MDREIDVVVIGYGYAGGMAAIRAHDSGASVLLLEKMSHPGGNSIMSGGFFRIADKADNAFLYLKRCCMNTVPDEVLRVFAQKMVTLPDIVSELAKVNGTTVRVRHERGGTYPFPGGETIGLLSVKAPKEVEPYPWLNSHGTGWMMFRMIEDNVKRRGIEVMLSTPAKKLIRGGDGGVEGVMAANRGEAIRIRARKGVVVASGGFEHNETMKLQFLPAQPFFGICALGNTGDGFIMSQELGAGLWHMWHIHGSYGFKAPDLPVGFRHRIHGRHGREHGAREGDVSMSLRAGDEGTKTMPWIVVDKTGNRYMNEYPPAPQDTPWRDMSYYNGSIQDFPRIPSYMILDEAGRQTGPLFFAISDDPIYKYIWSHDNSEEIKKGWIKKSDSLSELSPQINVPSENLISTIQNWNSSCDSGVDIFGRPSDTAMRIDKPPFYAVQVWPIVTNTQGALMHDEFQRVLYPSGRPIKDLYVCGEMGGIFGHLYLNSGNNSEAFITGWVAGERVAQK